MCFLLWFLLHLNFSIQHPWSRTWQPTPVLLGKLHGQRCLARDSPCGRRVAHDWARTRHISHSASRESHPVTKPWCRRVGWGLRPTDHWHLGSVSSLHGGLGRSSHGRAPGRAHRFQGPLVAALSRDGTSGSIVWSPNADTNKGSEIPALSILTEIPGEGKRAVMETWKWSRSVMTDSLRPHGLQPIRLLRPWDFPGKSAGVDCHFLLQRIFPTQGLNPGLPHCRQTLYCLSHQGVET